MSSMRALVVAAIFLTISLVAGIIHRSTQPKPTLFLMREGGRFYLVDDLKRTVDEDWVANGRLE